MQLMDDHQGELIPSPAPLFSEPDEVSGADAIGLEPPVSPFSELFPKTMLTTSGLAVSPIPNEIEQQPNLIEFASNLPAAGVAKKVPVSAEQFIQHQQSFVCSICEYCRN